MEIEQNTSTHPILEVVVRVSYTALCALSTLIIGYSIVHAC